MAFGNQIARMPDLRNIFTPPIKNIGIEIAESGFANRYCEQLQKMINDFEESLGNESEVGVQLVSFGQAIRFHLKFVGYSNPYFIVFKGQTENGDPVELIQHVSQISILFLKLKRKKPAEPKQPIGFGPATIPEQF